MNKLKVMRNKTFRVETFQDYKEMHEFIMSLDLCDIDQLNIDDDDYDFTYGKNVSWLEEETDYEYEQRIKREYKEIKYKEQEEFKKKLFEQGKYELYIDSLKREKFQSKGLMNYDEYIKISKETEWIGKQ